jgi:hypothetical protein
MGGNTEITAAALISQHTFFVATAPLGATA